MKMTIFLTLILTSLAFVGCQTAENKTEMNTASVEANQTQTEIAQVSVTGAKNALEENKEAQFIDVRTPEEYAGGHAVNAKNLPLDKLEVELASLDKNKPVYVICQTGRRSQKGSEILQKAGFEEIYNLTGGTSEWIAAGLTTENSRTKRGETK